jgi:adenylate/guanylate cyclase family protein
VVVQGGDYFGRTVNLAARIAAYASASRVLVSERVAEKAPQGVTFVELGQVQLQASPIPYGCWKPAGRNVGHLRFGSARPRRTQRTTIGSEEVTQAFHWLSTRLGSCRRGAMRQQRQAPPATTQGFVRNADDRFGVLQRGACPTSKEAFPSAP